MRIYPAIHYTMGGLWVDYNLMSTIPGLHVLGEANFSDHGANRLGASALMQGLADGYFVIPYTLAHYLGGTALPPVTTDDDAFKEAEASVQDAHRSLLSSKAPGPRASSIASSAPCCGMRSGWREPRPACRKALARIPQLREEFWHNVSVPGPQQRSTRTWNMPAASRTIWSSPSCWRIDALHRTESCGGHFREESQTPDGEARRDDEHFAYVAAWEFQGVGQRPRPSQGTARRSTT